MAQIAHNKENLIGQRFGRLLVIEEVEPIVHPSGQKHIRYLCRCDCGKEKIVAAMHLKKGAIKSCGCYNEELRIARGVPTRKGKSKPPNNRIILNEKEKTAEILIKNQKILIDIEDVWIFKESYCHISEHGYAKIANASKGLRDVYLHKILMKTPRGFVIDHLNGNKLDNRKANLRICTQKENANNIPTRNNRTGYLGVQQQGNRFSAMIGDNGSRYYIGFYETPEEAARAYDAKAIELRGPYACINFPEEHPEHLNRRIGRRIP